MIEILKLECCMHIKPEEFQIMTINVVLKKIFLCHIFAHAQSPLVSHQLDHAKSNFEIKYLIMAF